MIKLQKLLSYNSPIGKLWLVEEDYKLTLLAFNSRNCNLQEYEIAKTPLLTETRNQLDKYFAGIIKEFDLPINLKGTKFQRRVWDALKTVPYGETRTYKDIAQQIGNPKAARAIGLANNRNPISIIIPCHRIVGQKGLVGYGGGLEAKRFLLELESKNV